MTVYQCIQPNHVLNPRHTVLFEKHHGHACKRDLRECNHIPNSRGGGAKIRTANTLAGQIVLVNTHRATQSAVPWKLLMDDRPARPARLHPCLTRINEAPLTRGSEETMLGIADDPMMFVLNAPLIRVQIGCSDHSRHGPIWLHSPSIFANASAAGGLNPHCSGGQQVRYTGRSRS